MSRLARPFRIPGEIARVNYYTKSHRPIIVAICKIIVFDINHITCIEYCGIPIDFPTTITITQVSKWYDGRRVNGGNAYNRCGAILERNDFLLGNTPTQIKTSSTVILSGYCWSAKTYHEEHDRNKGKCNSTYYQASLTMSAIFSDMHGNLPRHRINCMRSVDSRRLSLQYTLYSHMLLTTSWLISMSLI